MQASHSLSWRGAHGEWYVVAQVSLIALVFFGPRTLPSLPSWSGTVGRVCSILGAVLAIAGVAMLLAGLLRLGSNLSPLPYPKAHSNLVQSGPYSLVRHPMYSGGIALAFGSALFVQGWLSILYALVLFAFLDIKASREERWLVERFSDYSEYQRHVRKLVPFVY